MFRGEKSIKRKDKILLITGVFMLFAVVSCTKKIAPTGPVINTTQTATIINTSTSTRTFTGTIITSATSTGTIIPSVSFTETPNAPATGTNTFTQTVSGTFTVTPTCTVKMTSTETSTGTCTITLTATFTGTVTETNTRQQTMTNTPIATSSGTPHLTPTATVSNTPFLGNIGSVVLSPLSAYGQTAGNHLTFSYTAGDLIWAAWPSYGTLRIKIPAGWSQPHLNSGMPGSFSVAVSGGVLYGRVVDGNDIIIKVRDLQASTGTITVIYGNSSQGAYVDGSGLVVIPVEAADNGEVTTELPSSPVMNIIPATSTITPTFTPVIGEGSVVVAPSQVVSGSCGVTMTFAYTAGMTSWTGKGTVRIKIPAGWSPPSLTETDPGYFEVTSSSVTWTAQSVEGQDLIVEAYGLAAFTGQFTITYGFTGAGGPGACVAGSGLVTLLTETDVDGADTYAIANSPQVLIIPPTATITETSTITMTSSVTPTITQTWTITKTHTITPTWTITETHTVSPTITVTLTRTFTPTYTITATFTSTPTPFWKVVGYKGFSDGLSEEISLYVYQGTAYVCYRDTAFTDKLTLMKYSGSWAAAGGKGFSGDISYEPSLFVYDAVPYVAFRDYKENKNIPTAMRYMDSTGWEYVGGARGITGTAGYGPSILFKGTLPYVSYQDSASAGKATVMYNNIGGWVYEGAPGLSSGTASSIAQYVEGNNHFIAYKDEVNSGKVTVKKFNGVSWQPVGTPGISAGAAEYVSIFTPAGGQPYVAYMDVINGNKATVKLFNGAAWDTVGDVGFSAGRAEYISLSVYNNIPSVAFRDSGNGDRAVVMKYNTVSLKWELFAVVSDAAANYVRLFIDQSAGKPYVAFKDEYNGGKATVMTYEGSY
jgi:hypothetical protein